MAKNMFKKYTESLVREVNVAATTAPGTLILEPVSNRPAVALTGTADYTRSVTNADGSVTSGIPAGGVGNTTRSVTAAFDGSWTYPVAGVANGATVPASASGTDKGTAVYRVTADGTLSLTSTGAVLVGRIDDCTIVGGIAAVQIGIS